jgi:hypothetical protein
MTSGRQQGSVVALHGQGHCGKTTLLIAAALTTARAGTRATAVLARGDEYRALAPLAASAGLELVGPPASPLPSWRAQAVPHLALIRDRFRSIEASRGGVLVVDDTTLLRFPNDRTIGMLTTICSHAPAAGVTVLLGAHGGVNTWCPQLVELRAQGVVADVPMQLGTARDRVRATASLRFLAAVQANVDDQLVAAMQAARPSSSAARRTATS